MGVTSKLCVVVAAPVTVTSKQLTSLGTVTTAMTIPAFPAAGSSERPLEQLASKQAIRALMSPGGGASQRLIRDAELVDWKVVEVDLESRSPHLRVRVHIVAAVFGTVHGHAAGSDTQRTRHALVWTLTLDPAAAHDAVWQLTQSEDA